MDAASIENRVVLYLRALDDDAAPSSRTVAGIGDGIGLDEGALSASVTLLSALEDLVEDGTLERRTDAVDGTERSTYHLTDDGRTAATALADRLADRTVPVVGNGTVRLGDADRYFDERPLLTALSRIGEDGRLHPEATGGESRFVGRESELTALDEATADPGDGVRFVRVLGHAGVGKTELLDAFADAARERGATVRTRTCQDEPEHPYEPALSALEGDAAVDRLRSGGAAADDPEAAAAWRSVAYSDLADVVRDRVGDGRFVLGVDDCHRIDDATLDLLGSLSDRLSDAAVTVVLASRRSSEAADDGLDEWWSDLPAARRTTICLDPFGVDETRRLIEVLLGRRDVPEAFVERVYDHTGGTPLFVEETVDRLVAAGRLEPLTGEYPEGDLGVPDRARTAVEDRLSTLSGTPARVLAAGATVGTVVPVRLLVETVDASRTTVLDATEVLVRNDVWDRLDDATVRFRSELVREVAYDRLDDEDRRRRHRSIARTLEAADDTGRRESARRIASHYEAAGDELSAGRNYLRAAEQARDVAAYGDAVADYEAAVDCLPETREWASERNDALAAIGYCHYVLGNFDDADRYFEYVRERVEDTEERQRLYARQARLAEKRGRSDRVDELVDAGLELDEESETACELYSLRGWARFRAGEYGAASEVFERERVLAERHGSDELAGVAFHDLGTAAIFTGQLDDAEQLLPRALDLRPDDEPEDRANTLTSLGILARRTGRVEEAADYYERALELRRETGRVHDVAESLSNLSIVAAQQGDIETAVERARTALDRYRSIGDRLGVAQVLGNLGQFERYLNDLAAAQDHLAESAAIYREMDHGGYEAMARAHLGTVQRDRGDHQAAVETLGLARELATDVGDAGAVAVATAEFARTLAATGEFDRAESMLDDLGDHVGEMSTPNAQYHLALGRGVLARERGDHEAALEHLDRAVDLAETMGDERQVVETRFELVLARLDREEDGVEATLAELGSESERQGMALYVERCRSAMERAGSA